MTPAEAVFLYLLIVVGTPLALYVPYWLRNP